MNDHDDRLTVYEIGFLVSSSIAEENVSAEADKIKKIIVDAGAEIIAEGAPEKERLAYTIRRKNVTGSYEKNDDAHFGWFKFEIGSSKIEAIKKTAELVPSIVRMLLITTVRENTFLGKKAPAVTFKPLIMTVDEKVVGAVVPPASVEDMDKSIDDMVKEV